jgi:hypothetical protein
MRGLPRVESGRPDPERNTVTPGKLVQFDQETWNAIDLLACDSMKDFQEFALRPPLPRAA